MFWGCTSATALMEEGEKVLRAQGDCAFLVMPNKKCMKSQIEGDEKKRRKKKKIFGHLRSH